MTASATTTTVAMRIARRRLRRRFVYQSDARVMTFIVPPVDRETGHAVGRRVGRRRYAAVRDSVKPARRAARAAQHRVSGEDNVSDRNKNARIIVVGAGPGGLFTAYYLAKNGYKNVTVVEK